MSAAGTRHAAEVKRKRRPGTAERRFKLAQGAALLPASRVSRLGDKSEARCGNRTGLARHRTIEPLALKRGGQVHFAALAGKKAGKNLHDTSPCSLVTRGAFA